MNPTSGLQQNRDARSGPAQLSRVHVSKAAQVPQRHNLRGCRLLILLCSPGIKPLGSDLTITWQSVPVVVGGRRVFHLAQIANRAGTLAQRAPGGSARAFAGQWCAENRAFSGLNGRFNQVQRNSKNRKEGGDIVSIQTQPAHRLADRPELNSKAYGMARERQSILATHRLLVDSGGPPR